MKYHDIPPHLIRTEADRVAAESGQFYFDKEAVEKVRRFATSLKLFDGTKAGQPATFLPWVDRDIITPFFGWKYIDTGFRRFRKGSIWCPKKVSKSTSLAIISLVLLLEEPGSNVYLISSDAEAAKNIYNPATNFILSNPRLKKTLWVRENLKEIRYPQRGKKSSDKRLLKVFPGCHQLGRSGQNAQAVIWDELGEVTERHTEAWHNLYRAGQARNQSVCPLSISTPFYQKHEIGYSEYRKSKSIVDGTDLQQDYLAVCHGVPQDVDWRNPDNWWPYLEQTDLGKIVPKETYLREFESLPDSPRAIAEFRCKQLGQWCESDSAFISLSQWEKVETDFKESDFYGETVFLGVDGSVNNLAAYTIIIPKNDKLYVVPRFFLPTQTAIDSDKLYNTSYIAKAQEGLITLTHGKNSSYFDWESMKVSLIQDSKRFKFKEIGFDPFSLEGRMVDFAADLEKSGIRCPVVPVPPYANQVSEPTRFLENSINNQTICLQKHPILKENALNSAIKEDGHSRIVLCREKATGRYDGIAALVVGLHRYLAHANQPTWNKSMPFVFK